MFLSFIILLLITFSGLVLTYLYDDEDAPLLVRFAAGNVVGAALYSLVAFLIFCFFGMTAATVWLSAIVSLLPVALLAKQDFREGFFVTLSAAGKKLEGVSGQKIASFAYYAVLLVILYFFF